MHRFCASCGIALVETSLSCPSCQTLVHTVDLEELANQARALETAGDNPAAAAVWGKMLALLPTQSQQAASIRDHRAALGAQSRAAAARSEPLLLSEPSLPSEPSPTDGSTPKTASGSARGGTDWRKRFGPIGVVLAFLAKFKTAALLLITKGKFLLLGLTKINTLLSMFAFMGVYWALYGWKFGVAFVLAIYVHEMGHMWALRQLGMRSSAPMFIPFVGAFVSLYDSPADASEDARIGLAGPIWGTAVALVCRVAGELYGSGFWMAMAHITAYMNLFNLIPVWQLDGGRGFRALSREQRMLSLGVVAAMWYFSGAGMFLLIGLGALYRIFWQKDHPPVGDRMAFMQYVALLITLGALLAGMAGRGAFPR